MGLSFGQSGTPMNRVSRSNTFTGGDFAGKAYTFCARVRFTSVTTRQILFHCRTGSDAEGHTVELTTAGQVRVSRKRATTDSTYTTALGGASPVVATWYDLVVTDTGANDASGTVSVYLRATASGTAGFSAAVYAATDGGGGAGASKAAANNLDFGARHDNLIPCTADVRDMGLFEGVLSSAQIERFGQGLAPFQLTGTLRVCPRDINNVIYDATPGQAATMTVSGTTNTNEASSGSATAGQTMPDGPIFDENPLAGYGSHSARYSADTMIYTSGAAVVEVPDLSGNRSHACQTTSSNQPQRVTIRGRVLLHMNRGPTAAKFFITRNDSRTSNPIGVNHSGASCMAVVGCTNGMMGERTSNNTHYIWLETVPNATSISINAASNGLTNPRVQMTIGGAGPGSQSPNLYAPTQLGVMIASHDGTGGSNNVGYRVDGVDAVSTHAAGAAARYPRRIFYIGGGGSNVYYAEDLIAEAFVWNVDQRTNHAAIETAIRARHALQVPSVLICAVGASSEAGHSANLGRNYLRTMQIADRSKVVALSMSGLSLGSRRINAISGGSGTFTVNEVVTAGSGGTGRFLCESGGQMWLYDHTGTWTTGTTLTGGTSGATRTTFTTTSAVHGSAYSLTEQARLTVLLDCLNVSTLRKKAVILNIAGNSFSSGDTPDPDATAALNYAGTTAFIQRIRSGYVAAEPLKIGIRMHQPTATANGADLVAYRTLLRAGVGVDFDFLIDVSTIPECDDYSTASDTGNTTFYDAAGVHGLDALHDKWAALTNGVLMNALGLGGGAVEAAYELLNNRRRLRERR